MAIKIEFVNLIIPIENINRSTFEGGFEKHLEEFEGLIGGPVYYDKHLFRMGWMDTWLIDGYIRFWENHGLIPIVKKNGVEFWQDLFAISTGLNMFMTRCDWIEYDLKKRIAWLKETDPDDIYPNQDYASYNVPYEE